MRERQDRPAAKKFFQAVGLLALALVSVYIIVQCFVIFRQSYKTETAIAYTMADSISLLTRWMWQAAVIWGIWCRTVSA